MATKPAAKKSKATMSVREYARHRGCQHRAVEVAIDSGRLAGSVGKDARGHIRIDPAAADVEWSANTDASLNPKASARGTFAESRARKEAATAEIAEVKLRQMRGELVEASEVESNVLDVFSTCRTKLLGIPSRLRQQLPHLSTADVNVVDALLREALEDLAAEGVKP